MKRKYILITVSIMLSFLILLGVIVSKQMKSIQTIFRLNETLKSEGYYTAEFEFKMLGCAYYLDHGRYIKAISCLNQIQNELTTKKGMTKLPEFSNTKEKLVFFKNLQNPNTGAFMDDSYPLFTYIGVTANMLSLIEDLSRKSGEPLSLKYPFTFLNGLNTPEKLKIFLNDLSTVGWIGSKFRPPYIEAAEFTELFMDMERTGLYAFSPECKSAMLEWFYENQDSTTGFWGARRKNSRKLFDSGDINATTKIIKLFVDNKGNNRFPEFPLRYKSNMFATTIRKLSEPMPEDLDEQHAWILLQDRGIRFLTRYLWHTVSPENKEAARTVMENFIRIRFEKYYVAKEGGFSLYPDAKHADLDGTGEAIGMFKNIGALSSENQKVLWGSLEESIIDLGVHDVSELTDHDFTSILDVSMVNSIRLYRTNPKFDDYTSHVIAVFYPNETPILDVVDFMPKVIRWVSKTQQEMGNWITKEHLQHALSDIQVQAEPISKEHDPLEFANEVLRDAQALTAIGVDALQIPRYKMIFRLK